MVIVMVDIQVKPALLEDFIQVTTSNAKASLDEPGIARFDVLQDCDDPTHFVLVEVYRSEGDPAKHKQTKHYHQWKDVAEDMMSEPRTKKIYRNIFPGEQGWDS